MKTTYLFLELMHYTSLGPFVSFFPGFEIPTQPRVLKPKAFEFVVLFMASELGANCQVP